MTASAARRVADAALGWVDGNRAGFRLPADILAPGTDVDLGLRPLGELAQLSVSIRRHTDPADPLHRTASRLLDLAWDETRQGALLADLLRGEPFATYPLEIYAAFAGADLRHPGFEDLTRSLARTRSWRLTEQEPNRRLGVLNSERRTGLPRHGTPEAVLRRTWLGGLSEPWTFERSSGYALTHTVFHLTDWGRLPHRVPADVRDYLASWLPAWLDTCLEDEQWDLGCELLAVAASLPDRPHRAVADQAWQRIAQAQDDSGAIPEVGADLAGRPVERTFRSCYHSTLAAAFAAVLTDARPREGEPDGLSRAGASR